MERELKRINDELMSKLREEETKSNSYIKGYADAITEIMILLDRFFKNKNNNMCQ